MLGVVIPFSGKRFLLFFLSMFSFRFAFPISAKVMISIAELRNLSNLLIIAQVCNLISQLPSTYHGT